MIGKAALRSMSVLAMVGLSVAGLSGCASSSSESDGTFTIWHYEDPDTAAAIAWNKAIDIFKEKHPDVEVKLEQQTFEQIQKNAKVFLSGDDVPDIMEFNKGNATAGVLASEGLIAPLTDEAESRGWDDLLAPSLQTTAKYDEDGLMGSGDWYGVPNNGEFVGVYYNTKMFADAGVKVPTTLAEFEDVLATFKAKGITPLAMAGAEYPGVHLLYQAVLANADRNFVNDYQLFTNPVDFTGPEFTKGSEMLADWVSKGYISSDSAGVKAEDMGVSFINGTYPMMVSGSWWFNRLATDMDQGAWDMFLFPSDNNLTIGSSGNLWVVPENANDKDLAYDFIDITLSPEVQNIIGEKGGLPVAGDASVITDPGVKTLTENFQKALDEDALAYYPDWPVAGFYDTWVSATQSLINQSKSPADAVSVIGDFYKEGLADAGITQ